MLKRKNVPVLPLSPTVKDQFNAGPSNIQFIRAVEFIRADQNLLSALTVNAGRVTNIRFVNTGN